MDPNVNPTATYDEVADEYIGLLRAIVDMPSGPSRIELLDKADRALLDNGTARAQLAALAEVRRELADRCPCGEGAECCHSIDASATIVLEPGEELP